jgi:Tfp pilus assembly protein PilF
VLSDDARDRETLGAHAGAPLPPQAEAAQLRSALAHRNAGRPAEAAASCREILARHPDQPHALLLLGLILGQDDPAAGAPLVARYLDQAPNDHDAIYNLGMLRQRQGDHGVALGWFDRALALRDDLAPVWHGRAVSLHELGRLDAASAAFERAVRLAPTDAVLRNNLGSLRRSQGRVPEALVEFDRALALDPDLATAHCNRGIAFATLGWPAEAEPGLRRALTLDPGLVTAHLALAEVLDATGRPAEAQDQRDQAVRCRQVAVEPCIGGAPQARVLIIGSADRCNVSTQFLIDRRRFDKIHLFLLGKDGADSAGPAALDRLPPFDIIFNSIADPDRGAPYLAEAIALVGRHDGPVLNPPGQIAATRRDRVAARMAEIPGLAVPATRRLTRDALADRAGDAHRFERPQVIRPVGSHGGEGLERLEHPSELERYLAAVPAEAYYLSDYWDFRSRDGFFRKYRFIFVDGEIHPYHLAIGTDWKLHYWRVDMAGAAWMKREEAAFLADYRSVFPAPLASAVETVARRLGVEYGGMDCGICPDGSVVLFEANANMFVHLDEPPEAFAYKHEFVPRIFDAVAALLQRRAVPQRR